MKRRSFLKATAAMLLAPYSGVSFPAGVETEIGADLATALLTSCPLRYVEHPAQGLFPAYFDVQALIAGAWRDLCRTDYFDNVATGRCRTGREDLEKIRTGFLKDIKRFRRYSKGEDEFPAARVLENGVFAVIDRISDG